jgi:uncharacterized repeat protein (TIGR01451 family)
VALSGDGNTALVGSPGNNSSQGAAYVFTRSGTTWSQQPELTASDGAASDLFGNSVALSGDGNTALVGAPLHDSFQGAAYVFTRSGTTWSQQQELTASNGAADDQFGHSVALSGDGNTALVGAPIHDSYQGAAYVFTRSGTMWSQQQELTASDSFQFGDSVALSGDGNTALVGSYGNNSAQGAAYVFEPAPTISKTFGAASIPVGGTTSLSFTIGNLNPGVTLSGVGFTDPLPSGLVVATPNGLAGSCGGGTITAVAGSTSISLSGATLAASASCTFSVNVTGISAGVQNNMTSPVTSNEGSGLPASASLTVASPPTIGKAFGAATIPLNASTSLTFTINNPNIGVLLTGIGFTDSLPAGLVVATPNGLTGSCGGGTITAVAGSASVSLSGAGLAGGSSCTFSVNVTGIGVGVQNNVTSPVTSSGGNGGTASASITVVAPPSISKVFSAATVPLDQDVTLTFTIANNNSTVSLTGVSFTDVMPAGLTVISATAGCSGTVTTTSTAVTLTGGVIPPDSACQIEATIEGTTARVWTNITGNVTSTNGGTGNTASATITVVAPPVITKAFSSPTVLVGSSTGLTFTITNPNETVELTGVGFTDSLPGLVVSSPNGLTGSCGGGTITATPGTTTISLSGATLPESTTCTFTVNVTATTVGTQVNTTSAVTSTNGGTGNKASATITVLAPALVNYFSNAHTSAPDGTLRITNPGTSGGNLCADIYVFDANEEISECCSCTLTPDGLLTLSVNNDVTGNPDTGTDLTTGLIVIVPAATQGGLCPLPTTLTSQPSLLAWATHLQTDGSSYTETETESPTASLSLQNVNALQTQCADIQLVGSGQGVCANSSTLAAICNN